MDKELEGIVQRMIDAGESEENIATVIQGWGSVPKKANEVSGQGLPNTSETLLEPSVASPQPNQVPSNLGFPENTFRNTTSDVPVPQQITPEQNEALLESQGSVDVPESIRLANEMNPPLDTQFDVGTPQQGLGGSLTNAPQISDSFDITRQDIGNQPAELGNLESSVNSIKNVWTRIQGAVPRLKLMSADVFENILGKDLANSWYANDPLEPRDLEQVRNEAYNRLSELESQQLPTKDLLSAISSGDVLGIGAGVIDAVSSLASTAAAAIPTGGAGLFTEMIGDSIYEFNKTKADRLGVSVDELYESGDAELGVPLAIGTFSGALEKIGLKGVKNAITKKFTGSFAKRATNFLLENNKEGLTEYFQEAADEINTSLANGKSAKDAIMDGVEVLGSRKGFSAYVMGVAGSAGASGLGRIANRVTTKSEKTKAVSAAENMGSIIEDLNNPELSPATQNVLQKQLESNANDLVDAVEADADQVSDLSPETAREVETLSNQSNDLQSALLDPAVSNTTKEALQAQADEVADQMDKLISEDQKKSDKMADLDTLPAETQVEIEELLGRQSDLITERADENTSDDRLAEISIELPEVTGRINELSKTKPVEAPVSPVEETKVVEEVQVPQSEEQAQEVAPEIIGEVDEAGEAVSEPSQAVQVKDDENPAEAAKALQGSYDRLTEGMTQEQIDADPELVRLRDKADSLSNEKLPISSFSNYGEYVRNMAETETDPDIIANEYNNLTPAEPDYIEQGIMDYLGNSKINQRDIKRFGDTNQYDAGTKRRWIDSKDSSIDLDVMAQELSNTLGVEVEPQDFIDFTLRYRNKKDFIDQIKSPEQIELESRYKELTGRNLTPFVAQRARRKINENLTDEQRAAMDEGLSELGITYQDILNYEEFNKETVGGVEDSVSKPKQVGRKKVSKGNTGSQVNQKVDNDAISKQKTKSVPMGESPRDSKKVEQGVSKPEKVTRVQKEEQKIGDSLRKAAEAIRKAKINKPNDLRNLKSSTLFDVAWDGALETAATALEATGNIADAVQSGIRHLKNSEWYKSLSDDSKKKAEKAVRETIEGNQEQSKKTEQNKATTKKSEPKSPVTVSDSFARNVHKDISSEEVGQTLSNIDRESKNELSDENKEHYVTKLLDALAFGTDVVENAKLEFGDNYVNSVLDYLSENANTVTVSNRSLITIALELDLERQLESDPNNLTLKKQLDYVRSVSIKQQREAAIGVGYGRLRQIGRVGYDISQVTNLFFSAPELAKQSKIIKAIQSDADAINKEAENIEQDIEIDAYIEAAIQSGISEQVDNLYNKLPSSRRKAADKAIAALDKFQKKIRANAYSDATGMVAIVDSGITTIKAAIKAGVAVADAIEIGINKINQKLKGKKWKEDQFRKDMIEGFMDNDVEVTSPKKSQAKQLTPEELLDNAKKRIRERIKERQQTIDDKRVELKVLDKKFTEDAEYKALVAEENALKELQRQYLTEDSQNLLNERKKAATVTRLENEIASIDKQIAKGEKAVSEGKPNTLSDDNIETLKAQKKARAELLEQIDPNHKVFAKQALIDAGYGREITVTTKEGKEKRQVLDWKKLAGAEGSIDNIQDIVEQSLEDTGYTDGQIARMQESFVQEYNDIRASIIEKSLGELERQNTEKESSRQRSSAERLAELYNFGLFDQNMDTYDYLINKSIGLSDIGQKRFFEAKDLASAMSDLYKNKKDEFFIKHAIREINFKITKLLNDVAWEQANWKFKTSQVVAEFLNLNLRNKLQSVKQAIENPFSGLQEKIIQQWGDKITGDKTSKDLTKQRKELSKVILDDITINGGLYYGDVNTPFLSKSKAEDWLNSLSDNRFYHGIISGVLGKPYLEGADSMFKADLTEKYFVHNLVAVLTNKTHPHPMTKEDALKFVSEQRTGMKFDVALDEAWDIIRDTNRKAGKKVLPENDGSAYRIAMDIVNANLLTGDAMTVEMLEKAYNAAYRTAGLGLGHVANNPISELVNTGTSRIEAKTKEAIKDKRWNRAAALTILGTIHRNFLNPFVGGGTNWMVLQLQKQGLDPISPIYYALSKSKGMDLSTKEGMKKLQDDLFMNQAAKTTNIRVLIGALVSGLLVGAAVSTGADDEYDEWLKENKWAKKYATTLTPNLLNLIMGLKNEGMADWFEGTFNRGAQFDSMSNLTEAIKNYEKGSALGKEKFFGQLGYESGTNISLPVVPWRFMRDLEGIYKGMTGDPVYRYDFKNIGFWNGYFNYGFIDYVGLRPERGYARNIDNYIPESDKQTYQFLKDNNLIIDSNSDKEVVFGDSGVRNMNLSQAKKYDEYFGKNMYDLIKSERERLSGMTEKEVKSEINSMKRSVTVSALDRINAFPESVSNIREGDKNYELSSDLIKKRLGYIKEFKDRSKSMKSKMKRAFKKEGMSELRASFEADKKIESEALSYSREKMLILKKRKKIELTESE